MILSFPILKLLRPHAAPSSASNWPVPSVDCVVSLLYFQESLVSPASDLLAYSQVIHHTTKTFGPQMIAGYQSLSLSSCSYSDRSSEESRTAFVEVIVLLTSFALGNLADEEDDNPVFTEMLHVLLEVWVSFIESQQVWKCCCCCCF
jgi:hypothetical protein